MKRYLLILALFFTLNSSAQTTVTKRGITDKNTIVKNDDGMVMPYVVWKKMIQSGDYSLKPSAPGATDYIVFALTSEEKALNAERMKSRMSSMGKPRESDSFKEGEKFKGEKLVDINGNKFDLKNAGSKIFVINFWFINCSPCKKEIPDLNELVAKYKDNKDVVFIGIALDRSYDLREFLKTMPFSYNVVDDGQYYATKYGVKAYPTHVIVGKDGLIKFSTVGLAPNTIHWINKTISEQIAEVSKSSSGF
jgi:thiol-disulfide isomerase/thioredoxin